jgi:hypothetical protein
MTCGPHTKTKDNSNVRVRDKSLACTHVINNKSKSVVLRATWAVSKCEYTAHAACKAAAGSVADKYAHALSKYSTVTNSTGTRSAIPRTQYTRSVEKMIGHGREHETGATTGKGHGSDTPDLPCNMRRPSSIICGHILCCDRDSKIKLKQAVSGAHVITFTGKRLLRKKLTPHIPATLHPPTKEQAHAQEQKPKERKNERKK